MVEEHGKELFEKQELKDAVKEIGEFALDVATASYGNQRPNQCAYGGCSGKDVGGLPLRQRHLGRVIRALEWRIGKQY